MADQLSSGAMTQWAVITSIPGRVGQMWPGIITFAAVEQITSAVLNALPGTGGGYTGMVAESLIRGTSQLTQFVTFQAIQGAFSH